MKNIIIIALVFATNIGFSQVLYKRTRKISPYVTEKYIYSIGTDREIKQGLYQALYKKKFALASGKYQNDKRAGLWHFFNRNGELIENFNYDTNTLQYEATEDSTSNFQYLFDYEPKNTDILTKPIKIGGRYFGYIPFLNCFKLPPELFEENIELELLISPGGKLAYFKIHLISLSAGEQVINVNIKPLPEEDKTFIPATLNKNPISSRIMVSCRINDDGHIDMK
ncbi:MAG: hypothetical protein ABI367_07420 [Mucilaginibacter sp.]